LPIDAATSLSRQLGLAFEVEAGDAQFQPAPHLGDGLAHSGKTIFRADAAATARSSSPPDTTSAPAPPGRSP
jgi:hypothetical protein